MEFDAIDESLPSRLIKVVRRLKRVGRDGRMHTYDQVLHVKKPKPGDRYVLGNAGASPSGAPTRRSVMATSQQLASDEAEADDEDMALGNRVACKVMTIPWETAKDELPDPIPAEIRKRFDDKQTLVVQPEITSSIKLDPDEKMLWAYVEPELLYRLETGRIRKIKYAGSLTSVLHVKIEGIDGYFHDAYLGIENLLDRRLYDVYGEIYVVDRITGGGFCSRAAAAYEVAKACGLDDIISPTVYRSDQGEFGIMVPDQIIERVVTESIAAQSQARPEIIRSLIKDRCFLQLVPRDMQKNDAPFDIDNTLHRVSVLRCAILDFILWTGQRSFFGCGLADSIKQKYIFVDNYISLPSAVALAGLWLKYNCEYVSPPADPDAYPLLWSDFISIVARLSESETMLREYEELATTVARRFRNDRDVNMVRVLLGMNIPVECVVGLLIRLKMLLNEHQQLAKDPYLFVRRLHDLRYNNDDTHAGIISYVNDVMRKCVRSFDLENIMKFDTVE